MHRVAAALLLFVLIALPIASFAAPDNTVSLIAGGKSVFLSASARLVGERVLVPLDALSSIGAKYEGNGEKREGQKIKITPANGEDFSCRIHLVDGVPMIAIGDIEEKLGIATDFNDKTRVLSMRAIIRQIDFNGSELKVNSSCPVTAKFLNTSWTKKANKLILEIPGAQYPANKADLKINNSTAMPINTGVQEDGETFRVVLDLPSSMKFRLVSSGKSCDTVVSFSESTPPVIKPETPATPTYPNTQPQINVTALNVTCENPRKVVVSVSASANTTFSTSMSRHPFQLALDLPRAVLSNKIEDVSVLNDLLESVHIEQKDPFTVRVVMNLKRIAGFDVTWDPSGRKFVTTLDLPKGSNGLLSSKIIVIDPGHGGYQGGAKGFSGSLEKDCTLGMALRVQKLLSQTGACVIMTRTNDIDLTLKGRADVAIRHSADIFLSIHCNSCERANSISGTEAYYHGQDQNGRALAECIYSEVTKVTGLPARRVRPDTSRFQTGFGVLRGTSAAGIPASLLEVGYINHSVDECKIMDPSFQEAIAKAIVKGLRLYVEGNP